MENIRQIDGTRSIRVSPDRPSNDSRRKPLSMGRSVFPATLGKAQAAPALPPGGGTEL